MKAARSGRAFGIRRRLICAIATASIAPALFAPAADAYLNAGDLPTQGDLRVVGKLPVVHPADEPAYNWSNGLPLVVDPASRRAYQFHRLHQGTGIRAYNIDTLHQRGYAMLAGIYARTGTEAGGHSMLPYAMEEDRGWLFFAAQVSARPRNPLLGVMDVVVVDGGRLERGANPIIARLRPPAGESILDAAVVDGLSVYRDPKSGRSKLLLFWSIWAGQVWVTQWDVERAIERLASVPPGAEPLVQDWSDWPSPYRVQSCKARPGGEMRSQTPIFRATKGPYIYAACLMQRGAGVVRLRLDATGGPESEEAFTAPGPGQTPGALGDPPADRLHLVGERDGAHELWSFDGPRGRWVGRSGLTLGPVDEDSFGIDRASGRVYVLAPNTFVGGGVLQRRVVAPGGLMMVDGRLTPVPQPLLFPAFVYPSLPPVQVDPGTDGRPRRIFVRRGTHQQNPQSVQRTPEIQYPTYPEGKMVVLDAEPFWLVLEDSVPVGRDSTIGRDDRLTVDADEREGVTGSSFEGSGGAYSARLRLVRGLRGASNVGAAGEPACWPDDRVMTSAPVEGAKLTNDVASGRAAPLAVDGSSEGDLDAPASRCQSKHPGVAAAQPLLEELDNRMRDTLGQPWRVPQAVCVGDQRTEVRDGDVPAGSDLSATAACSSGREVQATATAALDVGGVRISESRSEVAVRRDPERGVVVRAEAWVSGVVVPLGGSTLRIDLVRAVAESWSNGRPYKGGPRGRFERTVCGLRIGSEERGPCYREPIAAVCQLAPPSGGLAEEHRTLCADELNALANATSRILTPSVRIRVPEPDPASLQGSPGGYVAGVEKHAADRFDDALLNGDYSFEVPALEIILERGEGRQIVQLAGVAAVATYGVFCLPPLVYSRAAQKCVLASGRRAPPAAPALQVPSGVVPAPGGTDATAVPHPRAAGRPEPPAAPPASVAQWRTLLVRSAREGALVAGVWMSLFLPLCLAVRRRAALRAVKGSAE